MAEVLSITRNKPAVEIAAGSRLPRMLEFEQADGSSESYRYADVRSVRYHPDDWVKLRLADAIILIQGRNLLPVWQTLRSRRARLVRVNALAGNDEGSENTPLIGCITITDPA
jgi:hypothetical protein